MTLLAPWFLVAAAGAAALVALLHLFAWQRPPAAPLPTARFVPDLAARATSRALRPTDLALLALRVLMLMLIGLALSRPVRRAPPGSVERVIVADVTGGAGDIRAVRDSVLRMRRRGDTIVMVDSQARILGGDIGGDIAFGAAAIGPRAQQSSGALSAGLLAALQSAPALRHHADSLELVLVSPLRAGAIDEATAPIRALWGGRARTVIARDASERTAEPRAIAVRGAADDPVVAAVRLLAAAATRADVRIVRDAMRAEDSLWIRESGGVLVHWPAAGDALWKERSVVDTVGGLVYGDVVIAPFVRTWVPPTGMVVARWNDGEAAAVQRDLPRGCMREVRVAVPLRGDLALRPDFGRLVRSLASPCAPVPAAALDETALAMLRSGRGAPLLATSALASSDDRRDAVVPWLLAAALLAALAELWVRKSRGAS